VLPQKGLTRNEKICESKQAEDNKIREEQNLRESMGRAEEVKCLLESNLQVTNSKESYESHGHIGEKEHVKAEGVVPRDQQLKPDVSQSVISTESNNVEEMYAQFLLRVETQLSRKEEPVKVLSVESYGMKSQMTLDLDSNGSNTKFIQEKVERVYGHLYDHERKIEILKDVGEQVIMKTMELDQVKEQIISYASSLEPWRTDISVLTDGILNGARALESRVNSTIEGFTELTSRIEILENDLLNVRVENEFLKERISELINMQKQGSSEILLEEKQTDNESQIDDKALIKSLRDELNKVKTEMEWDIQRLESLVIEKILQTAK